MAGARRLLVLLGTLAIGCAGPDSPPEKPDPAPPPGPVAYAPPDPERAALELHDLLPALESTADPAAVEARIAAGLDLARRLHEAGRLDDALARLAEALRTDPAGGEATAERLRYAQTAIETELWLRGMMDGATPVEPWPAVAERHARFVAERPVPPERRSLADPAWIAEIEAAAGARFTAGNEVEILVDGPAAWAKRRELFGGARSSIDLATWAIYDDATGRALIATLLEKARAGLAVRVVVDGRMAEVPPFDRPAAMLEEAAGPFPGGGSLHIVRWRDPRNPYAGQHRKLLIVDGERAITGGMNFGDPYSHANPDEPRRWRDTDVFFRGPAVRQAAAAFESLATGAGGSKSAPATAASAAEGEAGARALLVDQSPRRDERIHLSLLLAFEGARTSIDVENAYYVRIPSVEAALVRAARRGVRVRLLTNSATSVDEPMLGYGILASLPALVEAGVKVRLKRGETLHSKFVVVDGIFGSVGSYNLHPRSYRLEGEVVLHILGAAAVAPLARAFEADFEQGERIASGADLAPPDDPLGRIAFQWFPDQL